LRNKLKVKKMEMCGSNDRGLGPEFIPQYYKKKSTAINIKKIA
jgi:hypothetical protein